MNRSHSRLMQLRVSRQVREPMRSSRSVSSARRTWKEQRYATGSSMAPTRGTTGMAPPLMTCASNRCRSSDAAKASGRGFISRTPALATVAALTAPGGVYNIVDDDPSPVHVWLPAFARFLGAPAPPHVTEEQARATVGEEPIYYQTRLRGASNRKAKQILNFRPRRLEWLSS